MFFQMIALVVKNGRLVNENPELTLAKETQEYTSKMYSPQGVAKCHSELN